jgi:hypothetical protein
VVASVRRRRFGQLGSRCAVGGNRCFGGVPAIGTFAKTDAALQVDLFGLRRMVITESLDTETIPRMRKLSQANSLCAVKEICTFTIHREKPHVEFSDGQVGNPDTVSSWSM